MLKDAIAKGFVGTGEPYLVDGFGTRDAADEGRRSINNAARHLGVSCSSKADADITELSDGSWRVSFRLWTKQSGREHVHQQTGGDPAKLAYNPFARAERPLLGDDGKLLRPL